MEKCSYCGSSILLGGVRAAGQRFCNNKCQQNAYVLSVTQRVAPDVLERKVEELFRSNCPKCKGQGPVDVHKFHRVWSILVLTRWSTTQQVSCRSCGTKSQLGSLVFSLFCGWWGFPWGRIFTPVQITRNVVEMARGSGSGPSGDLRKLVQVNIGYQIMAANQQNAARTPPPIPK